MHYGRSRYARARPNSNIERTLLANKVQIEVRSEVRMAHADSLKMLCYFIHLFQEFLINKRV